MGTFILRRLLALIPLLGLISLAVFSLVLLLPGDPAINIAGGERASPAAVAEVRKKLHFDDPFLAQYGRWVSHAAKGDLGKSLYTERSVGSEIRHRFPVTLSVALGAVVVSLLIGIPLGIAAGTRPGTWVDRIATFTSSFGIAMPDFWLALVLVVIFSVKLRWLPSISYVGLTDSPREWARHLYMPWFALGLGGAASLARQLRGALIDVLDQDYIRTARAMGIRGRAVIGKHALKNAAMPVVTILGIQIAYLLGGTVIMEQIFSIPGLGAFMLQAITNRDLPIIQGVVLVIAATFIVMNLVVDVVYGFLNPKVRLS